MTLKDCLYQTLHRNQKPLKAIAEELGVSESYLYRSALPDQEDSETGSGCRFPLKKLIPLIRVTGDFSTLDHIENALGRVAIPLPQADASFTDIYRISLASFREFGEFMAEVTKSLEDEQIEAHEVSRVLKKGYAAQQAITALIVALEKKSRKGK